MFRLPRGCYVGAALVAARLVTFTHAANAPKVTRADFAAIFQKDPVAYISLSPDGKLLAFIVRERTGETLYIAEVDKPERRVSLPAAGARYLAWTNSGKVVYALARDVRAVNADGTNPRVLADDHDLAAWSDGREIVRVPQIRGLVRDRPAAILVEVTGPLPPVTSVQPSGDSLTLHGAAVDIYRLDADTGERDRVESWTTEGHALVDGQGAIRMYEGPTAMRISFTVVPAINKMGATVPIPPLVIDDWEEVAQTYKIRATVHEPLLEFDETVGADAGLKFIHLAYGDFFGQRALPLVFGKDPNILYYASNIGRDTCGLYSLDLKTRKRSSFAVEDPVYDLAAPGEVFGGTVLVFDRPGDLAGLNRPDGTQSWYLPELAKAQARIATQFPGRSIRLVDWNGARDRVVFLAYTAADPGRYFVYDSKTDSSAEFLRRSGLISLEKMGLPSSFTFDTSGGVHLTGTITQPRNPAINPPPLVVFCRDYPGPAAPDGFSADAQALAAIGFVVVEVNHRGLTGFGQKHLNAIKEAIDRVPLEDIQATIEWVAGRQKIDRNRIAIVGEGMGGFLAVRALELFPDYFRCAVCLNAPVSPVDWAYSSNGKAIRGDDANERQKAFLRQIENISDASATADAKLITKPVLIMQEVFRSGLGERQGSGLRDAIRGGSGDVEFQDLNIGFKTRDPAARAAAYLQIADFMRSALYDFDVRIGPMRAVK